MAQFARAVSTAVKAGVPIIQAVNISMPVVSEYAIIEDVKKSVRGLESGGSFGDALKNSELFPPLVYNLIKIGEKSGNLEDALLSIAETYEADCEESVKTMTSLIEPVMILVMGGIVGFIVMAVLLPIMNLNVAGL
jgi:type II secretory pathway component PulF